MRLDHHQRKNQFDYFVVDVKPGQKLVASVETGENGVSIQGGQATVNVNPYAGISVHSPQRVEVRRDDIIGTSNGKKSIAVPIASGQEGKYYILVGSIYEDQNKDNRFKVELVSQTDANTDRDAPSEDANALEIMQGTYDKNYLSGNDAIDVFKINLPVGTYDLKVRPMVQNATLTVTLVDADGVELAGGRSPNEGAAVTVPFFTKKAGYVFIRIKEPFSPSGFDIPYTLSIGPGSGAAPSADQTSVVPPIVTTNIPPASTNTTTTTSSAGLPSKVSGSDEVIAMTSKGFSSLGVLQKMKFLFIYVIGPAFGVFLIGLLWGYIWGRRSGKRKTLAKLQQNSSQSSAK